MKISKILFAFTIAVLSFTSVKAAGDPITQTPKEIQTLLQKSLAGSEVEAKVFITFMLNNSNEIVVISTSDKTLDFRIKNALNYQTIKTTDLEKGKKYVVPFTIKR